MQEILTIQFLGLNLYQWTIYIGLALCVMVIALIIVKRR